MDGHRIVPSISALRAFEAVARQGSFVKAAESLNLSVGAVSHQIAALEAALNAVLFVRGRSRGERTKLTAAGQELFDVVEVALDQLAAACAAIRARRRRTKQIINVSANAPTCSLWLVPRVAKYSALNKKVQIRVSAIEGEPNLRASELDVAIVRLKRVGMVARRSSYHDTFLMGERVFPVCAPALLRKLPGLAADPNQLSKVQLLQEENTDTPELNWDTWLSRVGLDQGGDFSMIYCSGFNLVVAAAIAGEGVALGRSPLVDLEIKAGRLIRIFSLAEMVGSWEFNIRTLRRPTENRAISELVDFLIDEATHGIGGISSNEPNKSVRADSFDAEK